MPRARPTLLAATAVLVAAVSLTACSSSTSPQQYATSANLTKSDLPAGWLPRPSGSLASGLTADQDATALHLVATLPPACHRSATALVGSTAAGAVGAGSGGGDIVGYYSPNAGNATLTSRVTVYPASSTAGALLEQYTAAAFPGCLQQFLVLILEQEFGETVLQETVDRARPPVVPDGVVATAVTAIGRASLGGGPSQGAGTGITVLRSGRAVAVLVAQSPGTAALPPDVATAYRRAVTAVAGRLATAPG